jgi:uncharacterized DUF497 family protein
VSGEKKLAFEWDAANQAHIARHQITEQEAKEIVCGSSLPIGTEERGGEQGHIELGETSRGRLLLVVWTWRGAHVRIVTAFPANRKWRAFWRRIKDGEQHA